MLFNAVNYLRSKKEEERQLETLSKEEFQVTQLRWEKSDFSLKEKKKRRGWRKRVVVNEAVARIALCERYLSQCFALVRSFVMQFCSPNEPTRPCTLLSPFSSQLPTIFSVGASRLLPPDRKCEIYPPNRDL